MKKPKLLSIVLSCLGVGMISIAVMVQDTAAYGTKTKKEVIKKIAKPIFKLISKIKIGKFKLIKEPEEKLENFEKSVENYNEQFKLIKNHKIMVLKMSIAGLIQAIAYYAITYAVYKTFGNAGANFWEIVTRQTFLVLLVSIVPTPGAGLGAEGGFLLIFGPIFKQGTINLGILFWRIYTFYLPILIGALFMIPTKRLITKRFQKDKT